MTEAELIEALMSITEAFNTVFEFWLSITFAFVMAIHFTSTNLSSRLYKYLFIMYTSASIIFVFRAAGLSFSGVRLGNRMAEAGYESISSFPFQSQIIAVSIFLLMIIGTVTALVFSSAQYREINDT